MKKIFCLQFLLLLGLYGNSQLSGVADTARYLDTVRTELKKVWPANRTINLVFHGHSVPAGYWANHEVHTEDSYPAILVQELRKIYPHAVINIIVTAIGGEHSMKGAARFETDVLVHKPDVLFIDYALNDRKIGLSAAKKAWEYMIQTAMKKNIKLILLTPSPDQRLNLQARDSSSLYAHAQQIRSLAAQYHTGLADPFKLFRQIAKDTGSIKEYMSYINHPNRKGHELIAAEISNWFKNDTTETANP
jgi:acyl-CoA thioesterase-1